MPPAGSVPMGLFLADFHVFCEGAQPAHMSRHGAYWQGVEMDLSNQDLSMKPTDQIESWADLGFQLPPLPFGSVREDVYQGPGGWGFTSTAKIVDGVNIWGKTLHNGPETWREHDWEVVGSTVGDEE